MRRREFITLLGSAAGAWPVIAYAQQTPMHIVQQTYNMESWGEFRRMMMSGDFSAKVKLGEVMTRHPTVGVGAVADARGEISIFDGKLVISYGKTGPSPDANSEWRPCCAILSLRHS